MPQKKSHFSRRKHRRRTRKRGGANNNSQKQQIHKWQPKQGPLPPPLPTTKRPSIIKPNIPITQYPLRRMWQTMSQSDIDYRRTANTAINRS